jgi:hypothetical protein
MTVQRRLQILAVDFAAQVKEIVNKTDLGKASAAKRGRNPKYPYVPIIDYGEQTQGRHKTRTDQIEGKAYITRDEAIEYAQKIIDARREKLHKDLMAPNMRALRQQYGLPREITAATKDNYPVKLTLELTKWENLSGLIEFWRRVRDSANGGHSFSIEADRDDLGDKAPRAFCDGDGADHVGRILLNGVDVTKKGDIKTILKDN